MANITSKELTAISDQLNVERCAVKKFQSYSELATDPQLKQKCTQIASVHQKHFDILMSHLN